MPLSRMIRTITTGLLVLTCTMPVAAITLESLPAASQEEIAQLCLPVQFKEGATAYRNCVQSELDIRSDTSTKNNELNSLSFDDRYAVQQACAKAGTQSSRTYNNCVTDQISALRKIKAPNLDNFSEDELDAIQQACFDAQSKLGAAAFRQCLNTEVNSLNGIPKVDLSELSALDKNALQLRCSAIAGTAAEYRTCLSDEHLLITGKPPVFIQSKNAVTTARSQSTTGNQTVAATNATAAKPAAAVTKAATQSATEVVSNAATQTIDKPLTRKPEVTIATLETPTTTINNETTAPQQGQVITALPRNITPRRANAQSNTATDSSIDTAPVDPAPSDKDARVISKPGLAQELQAVDDTAQTTNAPAVDD